MFRSKHGRMLIFLRMGLSWSWMQELRTAHHQMNVSQSRYLLNLHPWLQGCRLEPAYTLRSHPVISEHPCFCKQNHSKQGLLNIHRLLFLKLFSLLLQKALHPLNIPSLSHHLTRRLFLLTLCGKALHLPSCHPGCPRWRYPHLCHRCRCMLSSQISRWFPGIHLLFRLEAEDRLHSFLNGFWSALQHHRNLHLKCPSCWWMPFSVHCKCQPDAIRSQTVAQHRPLHRTHQQLHLIHAGNAQPQQWSQRVQEYQWCWYDALMHQPLACSFPALSSGML